MLCIRITKRFKHTVVSKLWLKSKLTPVFGGIVGITWMLHAGDCKPLFLHDLLYICAPLLEPS